MRIEVSAIAHAPVDEVWSWWTDYGNEGDVHELGHGIGSSTRRVVEKTEKRVLLEEDLPLPGGKKVELYRHEVLFEEGRWFRERGLGKFQYDSKWFFEALPGGTGTRITRILDIPNRGLDFVAPVAEPVARKWALVDLQYHVDEFESERGGP